MNQWIGMGRLTKAPEIRAAQSGLTIATYTLAVDRRFKRDGEPTADFIPVKAFGKQAEFVETYLKKGMKIAVTGRIETGSFTGKDGNRVYTWNVIADNHEFCESKGETHDAPREESRREAAPDTEWMQVPDGIEESLPFLD